MWILKQLEEIAFVLTVSFLVLKLIHKPLFKGTFKALFGFDWDKEC